MVFFFYINLLFVKKYELSEILRIFVFQAYITVAVFGATLWNFGSSMLFNLYLFAFETVLTWASLMSLKKNKNNICRWNGRLAYQIISLIHLITIYTTQSMPLPMDFAPRGYHLPSSKNFDVNINYMVILINLLLAKAWTWITRNTKDFLIPEIDYLRRIWCKFLEFGSSMLFNLYLFDFETVLIWALLMSLM